MNNEQTLYALGISPKDVKALYRIEATLHRWYEMECGLSTGWLERDDDTNVPYWVLADTGQRTKVYDAERSALRRLEAIMGRYPHLRYYVQHDPRGAALYILRTEDIVPDRPITSYYSSRGVAVA